ncbi:MAG: phosphoribosylamine--glycine ligase, partial [Candidatus Omnitrophica bacterium]|nr:phosphoribosylamine--glycine ligase [Candidatus Omnitrophota bacterium]
MKILIVGSGGREHVLAWKIKQSPLVEKLFFAPGNGGLADLGECVDIPVTDIDGLLSFAKNNKIGLTVVGPEAPLVAGITDAFEKEGLEVFGPSKAAAQLEGSKVFSKNFMQKYSIPTAVYMTFDQADDAKDFLKKAEFPLVIKADGLAAGKGVIICGDLKKANEAIDEIMQQKVFKDAGNQIVIEECLEGEEASILAISDGDHYVILESSQDHKRIFDDDVGPNTGWMGAYSPAPIVTEDLLKDVDAR